MYTLAAETVDSNNPVTTAVPFEAKRIILQNHSTTAGSVALVRVDDAAGIESYFYLGPDSDGVLGDRIVMDVSRRRPARIVTRALDSNDIEYVVLSDARATT